MTDRPDQPASPAHDNLAATTSTRQFIIKGRCQDCVHYHDCPRMNGQNVCYGTKEVITIPAPPPKKS
ncbi:MAG: hypothetical protein GYB65_07310 [Chloroflexi bacterium]|nr:hypothetical protein [Chloroflexota bacterium]